MTADEARAMPGAFTAYRRTDGELICGEYSWTSGDYDCDMEGHCSYDDPNEIDEVVMVPVHVRTFMCHEKRLSTEEDEE